MAKRRDFGSNPTHGFYNFFFLLLEHYSQSLHNFSSDHYGENRFQVPHFHSLRPISNDRENLIQNYVASLSVHHSSQSNSNIVVSSGLVRGRIDSVPEEPANFAQPNLQSSCILSESNQRKPAS